MLLTRISYTVIKKIRSICLRGDGDGRSLTLWGIIAAYVTPGHALDYLSIEKKQLFAK